MGEAGRGLTARVACHATVPVRSGTGGVLQSPHVFRRRRPEAGLAHSRTGATGRVVWALALAATVLALGCQRGEQPAQTRKATPAGPPSFVGSAKCAGCHPTEADAFRGSDHARAMQPATEQTVLANFDQARVTHRGVKIGRAHV